MKLKSPDDNRSHDTYCPPHTFGLWQEVLDVAYCNLENEQLCVCIYSPMTSFLDCQSSITISVTTIWLSGDSDHTFLFHAMEWEVNGPVHVSNVLLITRDVTHGRCRCCPKCIEVIGNNDFRF